MHRTSFAGMHCSIGQALEVVGEWWTPLILRNVYLGLHRFDELVEDLGVSRNLLTARLDRLVANRVLERRPYQDRPARYEYHLTDAGRDVVPALMTLMAWGDRWTTPSGGPPMRLVHDGCGAVFTPRVACSECGDVISAQTVTPTAGPGAAAGPGTHVLARAVGRA